MNWEFVEHDRKHDGTPEQNSCKGMRYLKANARSYKDQTVREYNVFHNSYYSWASSSPPEGGTSERNTMVNRKDMDDFYLEARFPPCIRPPTSAPSSHRPKEHQMLLTATDARPSAPAQLRRRCRVWTRTGVGGGGYDRGCTCVQSAAQWGRGNGDGVVVEGSASATHPCPPHASRSTPGCDIMTSATQQGGRHISVRISSQG